MQSIEHGPQTQSTNMVHRPGLQIWCMGTVHKPRLGQVRSGHLSITISLLVYSHQLLVYPYLTIGLFLSHYTSHSIAKWALQAKCIVTTNQNLWPLQIRIYRYYK